MTMKKKKKLIDRIVAFLAENPDRKFKAKTIARALEIPQEEYVAFRNFLRELARDGVIVKVGRNLYKLQRKPPLVIGKLRVKSQGYGFVQLEETGDEIFISQRNMGTALDGDIVAVELFAKAKEGLLAEGRIDHVIERKRKVIIGTFKKGKYFNYVAPDDIKIPWDIIVHDSFTMGAQPGQKVAVAIDYWEDPGLNPTGRIVKILGFPDEPGVDIDSVVMDFNLPLSFPKTVKKEAKEISDKITPEDLNGRLDLRDIICFTIDPEDAKDFDDAVSLEVLEDGNYLLGVHIADVSHYVRENTAIDQEALERATSVYLVDRVIPMLPERLSNVICSLRPDEDRLTFSVMMKMNKNGHVLEYKIQPSVIRSRRRFSYEEVQEILDKGEGDYAEILILMRDLSQTLYQRRLRAGSLDFEMPEAKIILDEKGHPVAIQRKERLQSHQLVEEFMLLANRTVAEHVSLRLPAEYHKSKRWPFIYRVHERPSEEKIADFANLVRSLGYEFKMRKRISPKHLQEVLQAVKGLPEEDIINQVMLRSLMKAKYDVKNVGHFGLAFPHYTHFTSPIRRYPDLQVHRLLKEYADTPSEKRISHLRDYLPEVCRIASEREVQAMEAERASVKIKQTEFMADKLGEIYDGIISGIVPFGIFVEVRDYLVEGLVHMRDLTGDYYIYEETNYRLVGRTTGKIYRLGDRVKVQVTRVVPDERLIDFRLIEEPEKGGEGKSVQKPRRKSRPKQKQAAEKSETGTKAKTSERATETAKANQRSPRSRKGKKPGKSNA